MTDFKYVIIGAGMTADAAVHGIRELDPKGAIAIIGDDLDPPYNRPPLSKKLWKGKPLDSIWLKTSDMLVDLFLGRSVKSIEPQKKTVQDDHGVVYSFDKLLLATGGTPRTLPFGGEDIIYFRTLNDYRLLRELCDKNESFGVIGGGFIGSEIAAALNMNGKKVTMLFPEEGIGARVYPRELSLYLNDFFREKGVDVLTGENVKDLKKKADSFIINTERGLQIPVDGVIAGIGILPNVELARSAGLQVGNGILVNENLCTNHPDIFAAGDVAESFQPILGKRLRAEHEDNANMMGKQAGRNMAGAAEPYHHLSYFYSDLFELGYEAIGELDPRLETFTDWKEPFKKGVIYYLDHGRVRGVLLWNVWDTLPAARALIAEPGPFTAGDLRIGWLNARDNFMDRGGRMNELAQQHCSPIKDNTPRLNDREVNQLKIKFPDWITYEKEGELRLEKVFKFENFNQAIAFTDKVAKEADIEDHHPAILTEWGKVTVTWWTHKIKGLHQNDFIMAAKTDQLFEGTSEDSLSLFNPQ